MKQILIYGDSIFLAGLTEQLRALPDVQVKVRQCLIGLGDLAAFDATVFDLHDARTTDIFTLLRACPDLKLIGVNRTSGTLVVLSGQVYLAASLEDVVAHL